MWVCLYMCVYVCVCDFPFWLRTKKKDMAFVHLAQSFVETPTWFSRKNRWKGTLALNFEWQPPTFITSGSFFHTDSEILKVVEETKKKLDEKRALSPPPFAFPLYECISISVSHTWLCRLPTKCCHLSVIAWQSGSIRVPGMLQMFLYQPLHRPLVRAPFCFYSGALSLRLGVYLSTQCRSICMHMCIVNNVLHMNTHLRCL